MTKMTIGDLSKATGFSPKQIRSMCKSGVLLPEPSGKKKGTGHFLVFGFMHAVSLHYLFRWPGQISKDAIEGVLEFITEFTEDEMLAEFEAGRTHMILVAPKTLNLVDEPAAKEWCVRMEWPESFSVLYDLRIDVERARTGIARLAKEIGAVEYGRGRRRGLAQPTAFKPVKKPAKKTSKKKATAKK